MAAKKTTKKTNEIAAVSSVTANALGVDTTDTPKALKKIRAKRTPVVVNPDDAVSVLRDKVLQHRALLKNSTQVSNFSKDKVNRLTKETIKCRLPDDVRVAFQDIVKVEKKAASNIAAEMERLLRDVPLYTLFLKSVFGCGAVTAAYLTTKVDIKKIEKVSSLKRYCGYAVQNGRLERRVKGQLGGYNDVMRTCMYLCLESMRKVAGKNKTNKYLDVWYNYSQRMLHSERYNPEDNTLLNWNAEGYRKGARALIQSTGRNKAIDVLLEDIYTVWRAIEGLPVWPSYYAAKLGYSHGGKICVNAPKMLSIDEALEMVGHVGSVPLAEPRSWKLSPDDVDADVEADSDDSVEAAE